ncbi:hypothetical protein BDR04DRAFT_1120707 [Suillus decipiens]|nr:hypothetical protein BDR04DRAFT_1120707 [Suillus decipiens]
MAESSTSAQQRDGERRVKLNSPVVSAPRRPKEKDPPRYGAQYRQDALWEETGGNETLPPRWWQYQMLDGEIQYQDDTLVMNSRNRPLPGWGLLVVQSADESNAKPDAKLKASRLCFSFLWYLTSYQGRSRDAILHASQVSKPQPNNRVGGMLKYGKDFWDADTNSTHRPAAPPATQLSALRWRNLLSSLHFSTRPPNGPQSIPLESRRWNFNFFSGGSSIRTVNVPLAQDEDRIGITPETDAEVAAAMQRTNSDAVGSSTQPGRPRAVSGTQISEGQPTGTQFTQVVVVLPRMSHEFSSFIENKKTEVRQKFKTEEGFNVLCQLKASESRVTNLVDLKVLVHYSDF